MEILSPHQDTNRDGLLAYIHDRSKVWQTISKICQDDKSWTYVKPFQRSRDSRGAYLALIQTHYYLGAEKLTFHLSSSMMKDETAFHPWMKDEDFRALKRARQIR